MKHLLLATLIVGLSACASKSKDSGEVNYFEGKEGCFLLYNMTEKRFDKEIGGANCKIPHVASSTFKVPLAVIAFDTGALKDETDVLKWDGRKRPRAEENKDHDANSWMKESIVWYSQRLTSKIGRAKLQKYLDDFHYGNGDISRGTSNFWLTSPGSNAPALKISAHQQLDFMQKLFSDSLPASKDAQERTRNLIVLENSPNGFQLSGKTGSNFYDDAGKVRLGWFVGHLQSAGQEYVVVTNFRDLEPVKAKSYGGQEAKDITKRILAAEKIW